MAVTQNDGEFPDTASDEEPQGSQALRCGSCGDAYDPCTVGTSLRFHLAPFWGDRLPSARLRSNEGDLGARKTTPFRCRPCTRGYSWLWGRGASAFASSTMIKGCGTALLTIDLELADKQAKRFYVWRRVYIGRRMNELCPWLREMGIVAEPECADYPPPGLRETRAERSKRLHALRVAKSRLRMNELCPSLGKMGIVAQPECADSATLNLRETTAERRSRLHGMRVARSGLLGELAAIQKTAGTSCLAPLGRVSSDSQTYLTVPGPHIDIRHESVVS